MAHKWQGVIKAYADGYPIQFRNIDFDEDWVDVIEEEGFDSPNFNIPNIEWRVAPPRDLRYRIAIFFDPKKYCYYGDLYVSDTPYSEDVSSHPHFVQWLTDWIEYR